MLLTESIADTEKTLLGCCLRDEDALAEIAARVRPEHFSSYAHRTVFTAIVSLWQAGKTPDAATVADELHRRGTLEDCGNYPFLAECLDLAPTAANAVQYADAVRDWSLRREIGRACRAAAREADDPSGPAAELLEKLERQIFGLADAGAAGEPQPLAKVAEQVRDRYDDAHRGGGPAGIQTGLARLDRMTAGLHPGELTIVAARPGVGKTALAVTLIDTVSIRGGRPVLFVSLEQSAAEIGGRLACVHAGLDSAYLRMGRLGSAGERALAEATDAMAAAPVWVDDRPAQTVLQIAAAARRLKARGALDLVIIDYLQLVSPEDARVPRHEQVATISRRLKILARDLSVPVVALAQLNRGPEDRADQKPRLSDLRESGGIEADADNVLLLSLDQQTAAYPVPRILVQLAKQRNGPTGEFFLNYRRSTTRFENDEGGER